MEQDDEDLSVAPFEETNESLHTTDECLPWRRHDEETIQAEETKSNSAADETTKARARSAVAVQKRRWGAVRPSTPCDSTAALATMKPQRSLLDSSESECEGNDGKASATNTDQIEDDDYCVVKTASLIEDGKMRRGAKAQRLDQRTEDDQDCVIASEEVTARTSGGSNLPSGVGAVSTATGGGDPLSVDQLFAPRPLRPCSFNYRLTTFQVFDQHSYRVWTHDYRASLKGYHNNSIEFPFRLFDCSGITFTVDDECFREDREEYFIDLFFQKRYYTASNDKERSSKTTPIALLESWNNFVKNINDPNMMWMKSLKNAKEKFMRHSFLGMMIKIHLACLDEHIECRVKTEYECPMCYKGRHAVRTSDQRRPSQTISELLFLLRDWWSHRDSRTHNDPFAQQMEDSEVDPGAVNDLEYTTGRLLSRNASLERELRALRKIVLDVQDRCNRNTNDIASIQRR